MARLLAITGVLVALAGAAGAGPDDAARAKALFDEGRALAKAQRYSDACDRFDQSFALDAETGTEVNLADCLEHQGHVARAWRLFDAAAAESLRDGNTTRAKFARGRADALAPRLATVVIHVAEPGLAGLAIKVGDRALPAASDMSERVEPGDIAIAAAAPGRKPLELSAHAIAGATVDVRVPALEPVSPPAGAPVDAPRPPPPAPSPAPPAANLAVVATAPPHPLERRDPGRVRIAWILAGGSAVLALTGVGVATYAKHGYDQAVAAHDIATANHDVHVADAGTVLGVSAIALAAGAIVVYFTAPTRWIAVTPAASPEGVGLSAVGHF